MANSRELDGLMKFLDRGEWGDCFQEVLDDHFGPSLDDPGLDFEDLTELFGEHWAWTLWGCAFEDFLTQDFDVEGGNIVDEYLRRRGWKESARAKAYMKALRTSVMSLYEVSNVVPGKSLMARDLVRGGEPVLVSEGTATKSLRQWDRIAARIVAVGGQNILSGGLLPYSRDASDTLFDALRESAGKKRTRKWPKLTDEELQSVACMFSLFWQVDTLHRLAGPTIENSDGDEFVFHDTRFPFAVGVKQADVAARLNRIPDMRRENDRFWNWIGEAPKARTKPNRPGVISSAVILDDRWLVLGNIELNGRTLTLSTNSAERAQKGVAILEDALGDLIGAPLTGMSTVRQAIARKADRGGSGRGSGLPPDVAAEVVHDYLDRHYRETLDQPVSALGNLSPREAVRTARGRERVSEWLKGIENIAARQSDPNDPMATYDCRWLWKELGIEDLRR